MQSYSPENETFRHFLVSKLDDAFYKEELKLRKAFRYPPLIHLVKLSFKSRSPKKGEKKAKVLVAEGEAEARIKVAQAEAEAIKKITESIATS